MTKAVVAVWRINACVFTAAVIDETFVYYAGYNQRISASLKKANAPYKCRYRKTNNNNNNNNKTMEYRIRRLGPHPLYTELV